MFNLKDQLTLIIPVRDRHYNLPNIVDYYKDTSYRKLIYDTSKKKYDGPLPGFEYYHTDPEYQHVSYLNSYKMATTPFILNCPDDDIMTHKSIYECTKFLYENNDYYSCDGETIEWNPDNERIDHRKPEVFQARVLHDWEVDKDLFERLKFAILESSRSVLHSVVRREESIQIMQNFIDNKEICPIGFLDRVYTFSACCLGKFKTLPILHHIRTSNQRSNADRVMEYKDVSVEVVDGYGLKADLNMANSLDDKHTSCYSHFLATAVEIPEDKALELTKQLFQIHFELRNRNGGGGYFGPPLPLETVPLPHKHDKECLEEALKSMRL